MPTLTETNRRNEVAREVVGLEDQLNSAVNQLVQGKVHIFALRDAVDVEEQFTAEDSAEVAAVIGRIADRITSEVLNNEVPGG